MWMNWLVSGINQFPPSISSRGRKIQKSLWSHSRRYDNTPSVIQARALINRKFTAKCQDVLSSASSNYDINLMVTGITFVSLGFLCSLIGFVTILEKSRLANVMFFVTATAYTVMMFASSYVEEEHNFWYWVASGWFFLLALKVYVSMLSRQ